MKPNIPQTRPLSVAVSTSSTGQPVLASESFMTDFAMKTGLIRFAVAHSDSMTAAARSLGTSPTSLRSLCKRHKISLPSAWTKGGR